MMKIYAFIDTPALSPGWKYNLNDIKDIIATESFLALENKGCSIESYESCTTRKYTDQIIEKCRCLPARIRTNNLTQVRNRYVEIHRYLNMNSRFLIVCLKVLNVLRALRCLLIAFQAARACL